MKICPYCRNENENDNKFCNFCGSPFENDAAKTENTEVESVPEFEPIDYQTQESSAPAQESEVPVYNSYDPGANNGPVTPIPIGGYIAWSIFVILFCTIPGIAALIYVLRINRAATVEEQLKTMDTAKKILIVGTVLAVLNLVSMIVSNM